MDAREELIKITLGKTVTGLLLLAGLLAAVFWREALYSKWEQVTAGLSKQALLAAVGLTLIAVFLESLLIAYLLYLVYRNYRAPLAITAPDAVSAPTSGCIGMYGVLWDAHDNACCPLCQVLLTPHDRPNVGFKCPKCHRVFILKDDTGTIVNTLQAKGRITERRYELAQRDTYLTKLSKGKLQISD